MDYAIIIEKAADGTFSAYLPDLPGCIATGDSPDEVRQLIAEAVKLHIESLRAHGEVVPPATTIVGTVRAA
jgi:predicted RNase H-like HicB family nuclease